jgi:hypothetical protein
MWSMYLNYLWDPVYRNPDKSLTFVFVSINIMICKARKFHEMAKACKNHKWELEVVVLNAESISGLGQQWPSFPHVW